MGETKTKLSKEYPIIYPIECKLCGEQLWLRKGDWDRYSKDHQYVHQQCMDKISVAHDMKQEFKNASKP